MKRVVVTGATGFVGANLVRRLLHDGHDVHLLVRPSFRPWRIESIRGDVRVHEAALEDQDLVYGCLEAVQPAWVFHLATHGAYPSQTDVDQITRTNVLGTTNLVEAALRIGFESFVHTGSSSEYGFKDHPAAETERLEPNSHYAVTKAAATMYCRFTGQSRGVQLSTLRLYSVYGPWEEPTRLVPCLVVSGLQGLFPPLVDPSIARDFVYVDDVVDALVLAASTPDQESGAIYNVGTGVQTTLAEAVEIARNAFGIAAEPRWGSMETRGWDTSVWIADSSEIRRKLRWRPRHDFADGLGRFSAWLQADHAMWSLYEQGLATEAT